MKKIILITFLVLSITGYSQSTRVRSYTKKNGTHVESYHRTKSDRTERNNYSSKGNTNPYTGKKGYKTPKK